MLQNNAFIVFFMFCNFAFSQEKVVDTVYVYEEIIVHDTVFVSKNIDNIKIDNAALVKNKNGEISLEIFQKGKKSQIAIDTIIGLNKKQIGDYKKIKSLFFGGKLLFGIADNSLFKELNAPTSVGFGLGIWVKKQIFAPNFFVGAGFDWLYFTSPFSFNASQNNSALNGFYFTEDNKPKLFQSIDDKHFQLQIPIQFYYKIKKFIPSIGLFASVSDYKATFKGSSGNLPLSFDETQIYKAQVFQIGYLTELQYELTKHLSIGINFSSGKANDLIFTEKDYKNVVFKSKNTFKENRVLLSLIYNL
jgi:hypothetical protein